MDLLGLLPRTKTGIVWILVTTARYSKLVRAVPVPHASANMFGTTFLSCCVYHYGMTDYILTDHGSQFLSQFFGGFCAALDTTHITITSYHPHTNGMTERYKLTILMRLRHNIADNQSDSVLYIHPLIYAYKLIYTGLQALRPLLSR